MYHEFPAVGFATRATVSGLKARGIGRKGNSVGKINVDYPGLLKLFPEFINPKRSESASFLIWYLENYYRLDSLEAVDSVCDKRGDKGIDGIFVNDNDKTITVYQSRINQSSDTTIGDASLRAFAGIVR